MAFAEDYVTVNERIEAFKKAFPDGSLQSEIIEHTEKRVTIKAVAYRKADDPRPGIGHASMTIPGSTPFTRGSELENCETSAWGRALAALGFEVKRGVVTQNEIEAKRTEEPRTKPKPAAPTNRVPLTDAEKTALGSAFTAIDPGRTDEARAVYDAEIKKLGFAKHSEFLAGGHGHLEQITTVLRGFAKKEVA